MDCAAQEVHPGAPGMQHPATQDERQRQQADELKEEAIEGDLSGRHGLEGRHVLGDRIHHRQDDHAAGHDGHALQRIVVFRQGHDCSFAKDDRFRAE
jgi:hypothetical protein